LLLAWGIVGVLWAINHKESKYIKYDKKEQKVSLICAILFTIIWCSGKFYNLKALEWPYDRAGDLVCLVAAGIFQILAFVFWVRFLSCVTYFRRLHRYGYEIPKDKKLYECMIDNIPQKESHMPDIGSRSKESILLSVICWSIALGVIIGAAFFWISYHLLGVPTYLCMCIFSVMILAWIGFGFFCFKQSANHKYHDDTQQDTKRKPRMHFVTGLVIIFFLFYATVIVSLVMDQFVKLVNNSIEEKNQEEYWEQMYQDYDLGIGE